MALQSNLDTLDDVPEALMAENNEVDGKFVLDLTGIDAHPSVATSRPLTSGRRAPT